MAGLQRTLHSIGPIEMKAWQVRVETCETIPPDDQQELVERLDFCRKSDGRRQFVTEDCVPDAASVPAGRRQAINASHCPIRMSAFQSPNFLGRAREPSLRQVNILMEQYHIGCVRPRETLIVGRAHRFCAADFVQRQTAFGDVR